MTVPLLPRGIALGDLHSCILLAAGFSCWGDASLGQLGTGSTVDLLMPTSPIPLSAPIGLTSGTYHNCAWNASGVQCWGAGSYGRLGSGRSNNQLSPGPVTALAGSSMIDVAAGDSHTCASTANGAFCWGNNDDGQLGNGSRNYTFVPQPVQGLPMPPRQLALGSNLSCALLDDHSVWCWGKNGLGQVGDGTTLRRILPVRVTDGADDIVAGQSHVCIRKGDRVSCWGSDAYGQLGLGSVTRQPTPQPVSLGCQ
jgi:alpha-tubulin suppressor-like RCC1 family protein